ncbi:MAG TPA: hypothetical protein VHY48_10300 [Acidobacteriaceae bacterium]|jgi:hypothetical protein|nr:hypothetical protein [Acidobacteriaceae bacterium]
MSPIVVIIANVLGHEAVEVPFIENDDVIEQVSATAADEAFYDAILPWAAQAGALGLDTKVFDCLRPVEVEDAPTVMRDDEEAIDHLESQRWDSEEVHCSDGFPVIAEKRRPLLSRLRIPRNFALCLAKIPSGAGTLDS